MRPVRSAGRKKTADFGGDAFDLGGGKLREHGKREYAGGGSFGDWKAARAIAERAVSVLEMKGDGIMNTRADAGGGEVLLKRVAVLHLDNVEVKDMAGGFARVRECDSGRRAEYLVVRACGVVAKTVPFGEIAKLDGEDSGLEGVKPAVVAFDGVVVLFRLTVVPKHTYPRGDGFRTRGDGTRFSARAEILPWVEAESCGVAEGAGGNPAIERF